MAVRASAVRLARGRLKGPPVAQAKEEKMSKKEKLLVEVMRPIKPPPPPSPEEKVRIRAFTQRFSKLKQYQHLEMTKRTNEAIRGMWAAIDALPHDRRVEAINTKAETFPANLRVFTDTPPIKGFDKADLVKKV